MRTLRVLFLLISLLASGGFARVVAAQDGGGDVYVSSETGIEIKGPFLDLWKSVPDAERVFGQPLAPQTGHPLLPGVTIQHFQNVRMELTTSDGVEHVSLADLGRFHVDENKNLPKAPLFKFPSACQYYGAEAMPVCYAFLDFFLENGGEGLLGAPVTDVLLADGLLVQYFEKVRLEWHPELPAGERIQVSQLGVWDFAHTGNPDWSISPAGTAAIGVTRLNLVAFPERQTTSRNAQNRIVVLALDQLQRPVEGASVTATILYPDGKAVEAKLPLTDEKGKTALEGIATTGIHAGQMVHVEFRAVAPEGNQQAEAEAGFRIWW